MNEYDLLDLAFSKKLDEDIIQQQFKLNKIDETFITVCSHINDHEKLTIGDKNTQKSITDALSFAIDEKCLQAVDILIELGATVDDNLIEFAKQKDSSMYHRLIVEK